MCQLIDPALARWQLEPRVGMDITHYGDKTDGFTVSESNLVTTGTARLIKHSSTAIVHLL